MEIKFDSNNNVCEYFNERNGSIVHVLSGDTGLWFNLNDTFKLFSTIKADKLWFSKNLSNHEKKKVVFYRDNRKCEEFFIPEQKVHDLIAKIQGSFNDNIEFIYGIIADYDSTCINIKDVDLTVEERIALHALKSESLNFSERAEKYMAVLEGKTQLSSYYKYFDDEINNEIKSSELKYDNDKCPEDLRIEERESHFKPTPTKIKSHVDTVKEVGESLNDMLDILHAFTSKFDEEFADIDNVSEIDYSREKPYDDITEDIKDLYEAGEYAHKCLNEKIQRGNMLKEFMKDIERQHKEKHKNDGKTTTCPSWIKDIVK